MGVSCTLNLWIRNLPITLDYISNLPRYVAQNHFQSTMDDKSGYDHVKLSSNSRTYFDLEWNGWYFVYNTIPFGWKANAYLYHTIGMAATSYVRSLGVPCSQYMDDRHVGQLAPRPQSDKAATKWSDFEYADAATFICASILLPLGYFIGLSKSCLVPQQLITFLGFIVDLTLCAFLIPEVKKKKFADLPESILRRRSVSIKTLQRFAGKVTSFSIAVPSAQLHAREIYRAISGHTQSSHLVKITGALREELEHWRFLDTWRDCLPWPRENHLIINIFSDASDFAWGGLVHMPGKSLFSVHNYWSDNCRHYPIVVKEARALALTLQACKSLIANSLLDIPTDNMAFMQSWLTPGGKNPQLNEVLKDFSTILLECNATISFQFIPSSRNPADFPSRSLSDNDCMLSGSAWVKVDSHFGPHSLGLMSLDFNAQKDASGNLLKHFTPHPTPLSAGINLFVLVIPPEEKAYVFPPFAVGGPPTQVLGNI